MNCKKELLRVLTTKSIESKSMFLDCESTPSLEDPQHVVQKRTMVWGQSPQPLSDFLLF